MRRSGYGISVDVPTGWSASMVRRTLDGADATDPGARGTGEGAVGPTERTMPVVHVSSRSIPPVVGDFGAGLVELLAPDDVFVALVEYGSDLAGEGLFERRGWPRLAPSQFSPARMQRALPGRSASQHFFSVGERAFCLYTVIGSHGRRMATVPRAAGVVRSLAVERASVLSRRGVVV
jgi:hypothetical protein